MMSKKTVAVPAPGCSTRIRPGCSPPQRRRRRRERGSRAPLQIGRVGRGPAGCSNGEAHVSRAGVPPPSVSTQIFHRKARKDRKGPPYFRKLGRVDCSERSSSTLACSLVGAGNTGGSLRTNGEAV